LAQGIEPVNTLARLKQCGGTPSMSAGASADLTDAYEFIGTLRVQHQAEQIRLGQKPDNYVSPQSLSKLEREHLKEAFRVISRMQETIGSRYQTSRLV
jgi:CBS domain-containing protein